ncbi:MAG: small multi-drug export protein [Oligosphaeraceae bacterium]
MTAVPQNPGVQDSPPRQDGAGEEKVAGAWRRFRHLPECGTLLLGVVVALAALVWMGVSLGTRSPLGRILPRVLTSHLVLGAPMGAVEGAKHASSLPLWQNVLFNGMVTTALICLFNTLFGLSVRRVFRLPLLQETFQGLQVDARRQRRVWARFGLLGVFAFVFIPLPLTGPIVGSLLARLVGLRYWGAVGTVVSASLTSILAWGYAADKVQKYLGSRVLQVFLWGLILVTVGLAAAAKVRNFLQASSRRKEAPPGEGEWKEWEKTEDAPEEEGHEDKTRP